MIKFEAFGLPNDGLVMVEELCSYRLENLKNQGWVAVGLAEAQSGEDTKLYAVLRMTGDQALKKALTDAVDANDKRVKAEGRVAELERRLKETMADLARATERNDSKEE